MTAMVLNTILMLGFLAMLAVPVMVLIDSRREAERQKARQRQDDATEHAMQTAYSGLGAIERSYCDALDGRR